MKSTNTLIITGFIVVIILIWIILFRQNRFPYFSMRGEKMMNQNSSSDHSMHGNNSMMMDHSMEHSAKSEEEFIVNMIPHHQEAVDTAKIIVANSSNPELKQLATNIIDAQTKEIDLLQTRLKTRYPNSAIKSNYVNMMPDLKTLTGDELDTAFLKGMIVHHQGALQMANEVLKVEHRSEIMTLANAILDTQMAEINQMQEMLEKMN